MTYDEVTHKLVYEMIQITGRSEEHYIYRTFIQRALVIGMEHFDIHDEPVTGFTKTGEIVGHYKNISDAARKNGVSRKAVSKVINGQCRTASGLIFKKSLNLKQWQFTQRNMKESSSRLSPEHTLRGASQ